MLSLGGHFYASYPEWGGGVIWTLAILTGLLFFVALILHELSHARLVKKLKRTIFTELMLPPPLTLHFAFHCAMAHTHHQRGAMMRVE
jgi:hypothetical protein